MNTLFLAVNGNVIENIDLGIIEVFLLPVILVLVPAVVSFFVAKIQSSTAEKNIIMQIDAEVKKLELQYKHDLERIKLEYAYQQRRDNTNFLTKIRIEEASKLINSVIFIRNNVQIYPYYY